MKILQLVEKLLRGIDARTHERNTTNLVLLGKQGRSAKIALVLTYMNNDHSHHCHRGKNTRKISGASACYLLHTGFLVYSLTLKTEVTCSSEMSVDFHRTTRRHIP
jgi:hypothetical protein